MLDRKILSKVVASTRQEDWPPDVGWLGFYGYAIPLKLLLAR